MSEPSDVVGAGARSFAMAAGRPPTPSELAGYLRENQVPLLSLEGGLGAFTESEVSVAGSEESGVPNTAMPALLEPPELRQELEEERLRLAQVHTEFRKAAEAWSRDGIEWICFKSAGIPPSFPYTSENFDILFRPRDVQCAKRVLTDLGYVELRNVEEPGKWLFRLFAGGRSLSAIHVHSRIGWGQGFMDEEQVWNRRRQSTDDPFTWLPGAEDALLINVAHAVYENKALSLHDLMKIRHLAATAVDWTSIDRLACDRGWLPGLHLGLVVVAQLERLVFETAALPRKEVERFEDTVDGSRLLRGVVEAGRFARPILPFRLPFPTVKVLFFDKIRRDRRQDRRAKALTAFLAVARGVKGQVRAHPQKSALFCLSGVDGSGKTLQATLLAETCGIAELRARVMWARVGATPLMSRASRLWRADLSREAPGPRSRAATKGWEAALLAHRDMYPWIPARHRRDAGALPSPARYPTADLQGLGRSGSLTGDAKPVRWTTLHHLWALSAAGDFALWLLRIRWRLLRGDIVIADRYLADVDVELELKLQSSRYHSLLLDCLRRLAPMPTLAFLLDVDVEDARKRARPDSEDFDPAGQISAYRRARDRYGLTALDSRSPMDRVSAELVRKALREYYASFATVGNALFFSNPWQLNRPAP